MSEAFHTTLLIGKTMQGSWPWSMEQTNRIPLSSKHEPQSCWDIGYQVLVSCTALSKQIRDRSLWGIHLFTTEYVRKDKLLKVLNIHVYNSLRYMLFVLATLERGTLQETDTKDTVTYQLGDYFTDHNSNSLPKLTLSNLLCSFGITIIFVQDL